MQLCALFSQLHRHREALYHAQISVRISHFMVRDLVDFTESMRIHELNNSQEPENKDDMQQAGNFTGPKKIKLPAKENSFEDLKDTSKFNEEENTEEKSQTCGQSGYLSLLHRSYSKLLPICKELYRCCVREDGEEQEDIDHRDHELDSASNIDLKNLVGFFNQSLYHEYLNITNIMKLKRLDFRDLYGVRSTELILTRENILERVMLLITSYFCMGTELRFLKQIGIEGFENTIDAEYWHGKALEISVKFLPGDSPLTKHIVSSYSKHHSPSYEQIPEDEEVVSDLRVVKPFEGLFANKSAPLIKDIVAPSVKLSPLDLAGNDYLSDLVDKIEATKVKTNNSMETVSNKNITNNSNAPSRSVSTRRHKERSETETAKPK